MNMNSMEIEAQGDNMNCGIRSPSPQNGTSEMAEVTTHQGQSPTAEAKEPSSKPSRKGSRQGSTRPHTKKGQWSEGEEMTLAVHHREVGNKWACISKFLPTRSDNDVKNRWNSTLRSKSAAKNRTFLWLYAKEVETVADSEAMRVRCFDAAHQRFVSLHGREPAEPGTAAVCPGTAGTGAVGAVAVRARRSRTKSNAARTARKLRARKDDSSSEYDTLSEEHTDTQQHMAGGGSSDTGSEGGHNEHASSSDDEGGRCLRAQSLSNGVDGLPALRSSHRVARGASRVQLVQPAAGMHGMVPNDDMHPWQLQLGRRSNGDVVTAGGMCTDSADDMLLPACDLSMLQMQQLQLQQQQAMLMNMGMGSCMGQEHMLMQLQLAQHAKSQQMQQQMQLQNLGMQLQFQQQQQQQQMLMMNHVKAEAEACEIMRGPMGCRSQTCTPALLPMGPDMGSMVAMEDDELSMLGDEEVQKAVAELAAGNDMGMPMGDEMRAMMATPPLSLAQQQLQPGQWMGMQGGQPMTATSSAHPQPAFMCTRTSDLLQAGCGGQDSWLMAGVRQQQAAQHSQQQEHEQVFMVQGAHGVVGAYMATSHAAAQAQADAAAAVAVAAAELDQALAQGLRLPPSNSAGMGHAASGSSLNSSRMESGLMMPGTTMLGWEGDMGGRVAFQPSTDTWHGAMPVASMPVTGGGREKRRSVSSLAPVAANAATARAALGPFVDGLGALSAPQIPMEVGDVADVLNGVPVQGRKRASSSALASSPRATKRPSTDVRLSGDMSAAASMAQQAATCAAANAAAAAATPVEPVRPAAPRVIIHKLPASSRWNTASLKGEGASLAPAAMMGQPTTVKPERTHCGPNTSSHESDGLAPQQQPLSQPRDVVTATVAGITSLPRAKAVRSRSPTSATALPAVASAAPALPLCLSVPTAQPQAPPVMQAGLSSACNWQSMDNLLQQGGIGMVTDFEAPSGLLPGSTGSMLLLGSTGLGASTCDLLGLGLNTPADISCLL